MGQFSLRIGSVGANDEILASLQDKKRDADGHFTWANGDKATIADGATITFDYLKRYEMDGAIEPISFTINFVSGIAGNLLASFLYSKITKYVAQIKEIKVNGQPVTISKEQLEKAFSDAIDEAEGKEKS